MTEPQLPFRFAGCEIVQDRASDRILGIVSNTLSVGFLRLVQEK